MIRNSRDKDLPTKQEGNENTNKTPTTSSRLWSSGLRNPRIVRVSRAFGGKDRHSKVSTVRGLRDRRVRLSVPTAIQLYDLQDRLGVNQPSKVVDWLLNAAHQEIDKLPPLQLPQGNLVQYQDLDLSQVLGAENNRCTNDRATMEGLTMFPQATEEGHIVPPYSSHYHWDATNAYLSQFGIRSSQVEAPPDSTTMPMFPSYFSALSEFDTKNFVQTQMGNSAKNSSLHLGGPSGRPFQ